jgi:hypothetical protein
MLALLDSTYACVKKLHPTTEKLDLAQADILGKQEISKKAVENAFIDGRVS